MLLVPSEDLNDLVLYLLAVSCERFGILIHAYCVMSNHLHMVVTDPDGSLPAFAQYFCSLVARACNALHGHWESFWAPGSYSAVRLLDDETVLDKIGYTLANPVSAGLVPRGSEWPGLWSSPRAIGGRPIRARRPEGFFRPEGPMPSAAALQVVAPPGIASVDDYRRVVATDLERREEEAAERLRAKCRAFEGAARVRAHKHLDQPAGLEPRRNLNPRVACRDERRRSEAIEALKAFGRAYREAWGEFASGVRSVVFPHGTYWMRVALGLPCARPG